MKGMANRFVRMLPPSGGVGEIEADPAENRQISRVPVRTSAFAGVSPAAAFSGNAGQFALLDTSGD
jgi:hypothetical protein